MVSIWRRQKDVMLSSASIAISSRPLALLAASRCEPRKPAPVSGAALVEPHPSRASLYEGSDMLGGPGPMDLESLCRYHSVSSFAPQVFAQPSRQCSSRRGQRQEAEPCAILIKITNCGRKKHLARELG